MISVHQMGEVLGELIETLWNVNDDGVIYQDIPYS